MIISFGGRKNTVQSQDRVYGLTEELKDEQLKQQLNEAYALKQQSKFPEARDKYLAVLSTQYLLDSQIKEHVNMKLNTYRNLGQIYEALGDPDSAKVNYTKALKIKEDDPITWTRLGYIQYDHYKNMELAKQCFLIAIKAQNPMAQRSQAIAHVLQKLAEISFAEYNLKKAEEYVDAILNRYADYDIAIISNNYNKPNNNHPSFMPALLFAHLLKSYLLAFHGSTEVTNSLLHLQKAKQIKNDANWNDLEVIKKQKQSLIKLLNTKDLVALDQNNEFYYLKINIPQSKVEICPSNPSELKCLPSIMDDFLESIAVQAETITYSGLQSSLLTCPTFILLSQKELQNHNFFFEIYQQGLKQRELEFEEVASSQAQQPKPVNSKKQNTQRQLRNKKDQVETLLLQCKVQALKDYKEQLVNEVDQNDAILDFIFSQDFVDEDLELFQTCLTKLDNKGMIYVFRQLLRRFINQEPLQYQSNKNYILNFVNAHSLYRIFKHLLNSDFTKSHLDQVKSLKIILTMFEIALYNKLVIKNTKSFLLMNQRFQLFQYFEENLLSIEYDLDILKRTDPEQSEELRNRLLYSMMYYSFEEKNDMSMSIVYYQKLDLTYFKRVGCLRLPWVSSTFVLDEEHIKQFGDFKIKQAQVVRTFDEQLNQLKKDEVQEIHVLKAVGERHKAFEGIVGFYFDQFCSYLQKACQSEGNNSSNCEAKVSEMWTKLTYCLCRCDAALFFKIVNHLFTMIAAFQLHQKQFYDQFILRKFDFEEIMSSMNEKLKRAFNGVVNLVKQDDHFKTIPQLREVLVPKLESMMGAQENQLSLIFTRLEVHLLRLFNSEFLYYTVYQNNSKYQDQAGCNGLLSSYLQNLFFIQVFQAFLKHKGLVHLSVAFKGILSYLKTIDKLSQNNTSQNLPTFSISIAHGEIFVKPYIKLISIAFPFLMQLYCAGLKAKMELVSEGDAELLETLIHLTNYFFDTKLDFDDIDHRNHEEDQSQDTSEDIDEKYEYLESLKTKSIKIGTNAKNTTTVSTQNLFFQYVQNQCSSSGELYFLCDLVYMCNQLSGNSLMEQGRMSFKDVENLQTVIQLISNYFQNNYRTLKQRCPYLKDQADQFNKNPLIGKDIALRQDKECRICYCQVDCFREELVFCSSVFTLSFFMTNFYAHIALNSSPFQLIKQKPKKKESFIEILKHNANDSYLLKLEQIAQIGLQYSQHQSYKMLYLIGLIQAELFVQANQEKLYVDYNEEDNYKRWKDHFTKSIHTSLAGLQMTQVKSNDQVPVWDSLGLIQIQKLLVESIMSVVLAKESMLTYSTKHSAQKCFNKSKDKTISKNLKLQNLRGLLYVLSSLCERLDIIDVLKDNKNYNLAGDPRIAKQKPKPFNESTHLMIDIFLSMMMKHCDQSKFRVMDIIVYLDTHKLIMDNWGSYPISHLKEDKLGYKYPYIQAYAVKKLNKISIKQTPVEYLCRNSNIHLTYLKNAIKIASANKQVSGGLECIIECIGDLLGILFILKYKRDSLQEADAIKIWDIMNQFAKIILQEKVIFNLLAAKESNLPEEEEVKEQAMDYQSEDNEDEDEGAGLTTEMKADEKLSLFLFRVELFQTSAIPQFCEFENLLSQLFKHGDEIFNELSKSQKLFKLWSRVKLQTTLLKCLKEEIVLKEEFCLKNRKDKEGLGFKRCKEHYKRMADLLITFMQGLLQAEEKEGEISYYLDSENQKCYIGSLNYSEPAVSTTRMSLRTVFMKLNEEGCTYEEIRNIFKKYLQMFKTQDTRLPQHKAFESHYMFYLSKDTYINTICSNINSQIINYIELRKKYMKQEGNKIGTTKSTLEQFKQGYVITKEKIPELLKNIFELFVDTHQKKTFLVGKKLVDDHQKWEIRLAVIRCCAVCGPDSDLDISQNGKASSKFLDFGKIMLDDYATEALMICGKWFMSVLEPRTHKKEIDLSKKLKVAMEDFERQVKEVAQNNSLQHQLSFGMERMPHDTMIIDVEPRRVGGLGSTLHEEPQLVQKVFNIFHNK